MNKYKIKLNILGILIILLGIVLVGCSNPTDSSPDTEQISVTGVTLNKASTGLVVGQPELLVATVVPADAANKDVTWSTSNSSIASVNPDGQVTGVAPGTAIITVTTVDGTKTAACAVTINRYNSE